MHRILFPMLFLALGCGPNKSMQKGDKVFDSFAKPTSTEEHVQIATPGGASKTVTLPPSTSPRK